MIMQADAAATPKTRTYSYRHRASVRIFHWLNVVFLTVMLGSGLQIFNAHPALYWGSRSDTGKAWLSMTSVRSEQGGIRGITQLFGTNFDTTGLLGASSGEHEGLETRGFPRWATLPSNRWLAMGRRWHFFFAWLFVLNGLFYVLLSVKNRHLFRDLLPRGSELKDVGGSIGRHLHLRHLRADSQRGYNVLQKLSYLAVVFLFGPLMILTGLTMSPWIDSVFPQLLTVFDGRQSARTIHFLVAFGFVLFVIVHLVMVILVGPINHIRAMITGRLKVERDS